MLRERALLWFILRFLVDCIMSSGLNALDGLPFDVNDILDVKLMPPRLFTQSFSTFLEFKNLNNSDVDEMVSLNCTDFSTALNTMGFHRRMMNEYLATRFLAEELIHPARIYSITRRMGTATMEPGSNNTLDSDRQQRTTKHIANHKLLTDEGSTNYKDWLQRSTTLEDIRRQLDGHIHLNRSIGKHKRLKIGHNRRQFPQDVTELHTMGEDPDEEEEEEEFEDGDITGYAMSSNNPEMPQHRLNTINHLSNDPVYADTQHNDRFTQTINKNGYDTSFDSYGMQLPHQSHPQSYSPHQQSYSSHSQPHPQHHPQSYPTHPQSYPSHPQSHPSHPQSYPSHPPSYSPSYSSHPHSYSHPQAQSHPSQSVHPIPVTQTHPYPEAVPHSIPSAATLQNKEISLKDITDIALTTLAFLSFGMFTLQVLICITMGKDDSANMMMLPMEGTDNDPDPVNDGTEEIRRRKKRSTSDSQRLSMINDLSRRVLHSIDAALLYPEDYGSCHYFSICENNRFAGKQLNEQKLWIPVWSLGMSWFTSRLSIDQSKMSNNYLPILQSLKATVIGLGNGNCKQYYGKKCKLHSELNLKQV